ncbi:TPA: hypothetical protein ACH3X2_001765 [Trebouxia sp. C0005]
MLRAEPVRSGYSRNGSTTNVGRQQTGCAEWLKLGARSLYCSEPQHQVWSWCVVQAAHLRAQSCHSLVHHSSVEEVEVRKHGSDGVHMTKLRTRGISAWA